jgi:hypothetical protein
LGNWQIWKHFGASTRRTLKSFNYQIAQLPNYEIKFMANTATLSKDNRKKAKRAARKRRKLEHPLKPREYPRGSQKRKVKKMARGQAKR